MRANTFVSGVIAGAALGVLVMMAMSQQNNEPMMRGAVRMGKRMRGMWQRGTDRAIHLLPVEVD